MSPRPRKESIDIPAHPDRQHELELQAQGYRCICGIDEAGRGPLAGPVVAAAVILPPSYEIAGLTDSKKLSAKKRDLLYKQLMDDESVLKSIAEASVEEIDKLNILRATHLAMRRAAEGLAAAPDMCLIDGLAVKDFPFPQTPLVKGDARNLSIAAASILAKVSRDATMQELDRQHPEYGFAKHSGYGTAQHLRALQEHGITKHHRRSFGPVSQRSLDLGM